MTVNIWSGKKLIFKEYYPPHVYQRMAAHHTKDTQHQGVDFKALIKKM
jgi:hypothetical protein